MKKIISSLAIILTVALILCMGVFLGACDDGNTPAATDLTVTVVYPDGSPVDGTKDGNGQYDGNVIKVQFCDADDEANCYQLLNLGADGKVTIAISTLKEALGDVNNFSMHVRGLPSDYSYDEDIVLNASNATVTVTLVASN